MRLWIESALIKFGLWLSAVGLSIVQARMDATWRYRIGLRVKESKEN